MNNSEKEILVIFTGGTISSRQKEDSTLGVSEKVVWQLLDAYEKSDEVPVKFRVLQPFTMLSENCLPENWQMLLDVLRNVDFSKYRGIIITHGTDTLCYSAALLAYFFCHITIPLVMIGSNYPLTDERSNGCANFFSAVRFIRQDRWKGVFVIFRNKDGKNLVYLPTRLQEADAYEDEFSAFGGVALGEVKPDGFVYYPDDRNPPEEKLWEKHQPAARIPDKLDADILMIHPYPGLDYERISLERKPAAVLHGLYHSATACTVGERYSVLRFLEHCRREKIPVYVFSVKPGEKQYETGNALLCAGAVPLYNMTAPAAYMKLVAAYSQKEEAPEKWMQRQYYFENLP